MIKKLQKDFLKSVKLKRNKLSQSTLTIITLYMLKLKNSHLNDDRVSQIVSWGHWFALFNSFVVIILGSRYLFIADWPPTLLGRIYAIISCIGHFSFLTFVVYIVILFPLSFIIHSSKWQRIIATLVATIAISILLIDIEVFTRFRMHLNFSIWQILTSSDDNILSAEWQKLFIFVPLILLLETLFAIWSWRKLRSLTKRRRYCRPVIIVFILSFLLSHLIHTWADANFYRPITMQRSSLPISYPLTARHLLERYGFLDGDNYQSRIEREGNPFAIAIEYPLGKISYDISSNNPYNVLMIVVDDWDRALLTKNMPFLTQFSEENIYFDNHYSSSEKSHLGEFSLFYGLDPNYYNSILASHKSSVLLDMLTRQRYNLGLFSSDEFAHPLYRYALLSNFSMPDAKMTPNQETTRYWLSWFDEQNNNENKRPWFSIIQYQMSPNGNKKNQRDNIKQISLLDQSIADIIASIDSAGQLDKTVVIITGANGYDSSVIQTKDHQDYQPQALKTPLIVSWPNREHQVMTKQTSHVDVLPTLMQEVLNVKTPIKQFSQGANLLQSNSDRKWLIAGNESEIAVLDVDKIIVIDANGYYRIYDSNNQLQEDEKLGLSTFLQLITENRRFMVTN